MSICIPQANPKAENDELADEISSAFKRVLASGRYILGPEVGAFEKEFAQYIGVEHAIGVASGTDALYLSLRALQVGPGDEVITVSHTAVATIAAIEQTGATPVLVDIRPDTFTMDMSLLDQCLTSRLKVVIPVHLYGHPADMDAILAFARKHGLYVLEDCAQAHGALYKGKHVGAWGDIAAFSFYPTKNLGAMGDGGMIVTNNPQLAERAQLLRQYGWNRRYISEIQGVNSRLDELQAAILRVKLNHLDENNNRRWRLAQEYQTALFKVELPIELPTCRHVFHLYVVRHPQRDTLQEFLKSRGIGTLVHYPVPVHLQPAYLGRLSQTNLAITETVAKQILSLPLYPSMSIDQVHEVARAIEDFNHDRAAR